MSRPPFPPFTQDTANQKVRMAEEAWNTRDPERVSVAYTENSVWRNRAEFIEGRTAIVGFLKKNWNKEHDFGDVRIAVRFAYEWRDDGGNWFRSYGNENWEFDGAGLMARRIASINDLPITDGDRRFNWLLGRRPDDYSSLNDLGL